MSLESDAHTNICTQTTTQLHSHTQTQKNTQKPKHNQIYAQTHIRTKTYTHKHI
jgi:hypothetical protein